MRRLSVRRMLSAAAVAAALAGLSAGPTGPVAEATGGHPATHHPVELTSDAPVTVVAGGLNGPRSLAWGRHGHLMVSEAGTIPATCDGTDPATKVCYGATASIADVSSGVPVRIRTGLPSLYFSEGMIGPNGLTYADGTLYALETASPQSVPAGLPADLAATLTRQYGALLKITGGSVSVVANPGDTDYRWMMSHTDQTTSVPFADSYSVTPKPGGGFYTVDAAANTLDSVDQHGHVTVLTTFPRTPFGTDAVPTCVAVDPDGAVYVGQFTGFGNSATAANVYRYSPKTGALTVWQSGFSTISGCGFGANGDFYVTELDTTGFPSSLPPDGVVVQIGRDGERTVLGAGKLYAPAGFLAGPDGSVYVANKTTLGPSGTTDNETAGEIVRIG
ncbi:ScyD/ScyE family protein [Actinacidiphila bryophytorum]|uniref:ScyD/ScyE family protein n=1 Tax=Actinacidiphila bryophytorum TaxID=1436133 RepID=A0A9W4H1K8_9ACTN|nr:ScyD/ScyE family protein [Actinacidiphila bryophytorum]MBM9435036.1 ScyD/ScyE family protein [Actinacidiphila bryophytorum]MBN6542089.1 ScyD/ScyE family protein [Actinacidiphila bryophytorum]CAG7642623.1 conserved exported hypothetical protein [Actinacidiphila bryophytorum]